MRMRRREQFRVTSPLGGEVAERSKIARRVRGSGAFDSAVPPHPDLAPLDPTSPPRGEVKKKITGQSFITLMAGGAACSLSSAREARSNPANRMRRIGVLMGGAEHDLDWPRLEAAIEQEFKNLGWTRGRDLRIDWRWPGNEMERIVASAIELVELGPDVIVTAAAYGVQALRQRTDSIPIVFVNVADPVGSGIVTNLMRPGANITGFAAADYTISQKWLELAKEIAPRAARIGVLFNPETASIARNFLKPIEAASPR